MVVSGGRTRHVTERWAEEVEAEVGAKEKTEVVDVTYVCIIPTYVSYLRVYHTYVCIIPNVSYLYVLVAENL